MLDTGVLVAVARGHLDLSVVATDDDVALPALAIAEFLVGVELDTDPARRAGQRAFLDDVLSVVPVATASSPRPGTVAGEVNRDPYRRRRWS